MATIKSVVCTLTDCPLENAAVFATRRVASRQYLLVRVQCDDGHEGIGAAYCGDRGGEVAFAAVEHVLARKLIGQDPYAVEALWQEMYQESLLQGRAGAAVRALSALDIALWDHNARAAGLPLWKFLGAFFRGSVPIYASGGYYYGADEPKNLAKEMNGYVAAGFKAVKMKVGRASLSEDGARVAAAREAVGPDVLLMMDANNGWADVPTALRFLKAVEPYNPFWIEEPFGPDDIENHARLARQTSIPIASGEIEAGRWRFREWVRHEAAQILQPDVFACGGITEWRRIAAFAAGCGLPICTHAWHDFHAPLIASVPNGMFVEVFTNDRIVNLQWLIDEPLEMRDGRLVLSERPGLGFNFDEAAISRFARIPWREMRNAD